MNEQTMRPCYARLKHFFGPQLLRGNARTHATSRASERQTPEYSAVANAPAAQRGWSRRRRNVDSGITVAEAAWAYG